MEKHDHEKMWGTKKNPKREEGIQIQEVQNRTRVQPPVCNSSKPPLASFYVPTKEPMQPIHRPTNMDSVIKSFTPSVTIQSLTENSGNNSNLVHYFKLEDLWETYREWSAYGVGVPLVLDGKSSCVQYYTPSLSAIQLYGNPTDTPSKSRQLREKSNYGSHSSRTSSNENDVHSNNHMGISSSIPNGKEVFHPLGKLMFEYIERENPFLREPLTDKVFKLAARHPELNSYRSCDLEPSSWMSVAWYPIYRIPTGQNLGNIEASFLTFHSLGLPENNMAPLSTDVTTMKSTSLLKNNGVKIGKFQVPIFGMAYYKMKGSMWNPINQYESQQAFSMMLAADDWVHSLGINHYDLEFFKSHS